MPDRRRVLIVGGGIAGLALAPMLARTGVAVEMIERERGWRDAGTGTYLPGNAVRALGALGLEAGVASRAVEIARQRFCDHRGNVLFEVDLAELWAAVGPCLAVHRAELHVVLREAARDVSIRTGLAVAERLGKLFSEFAEPAATLLAGLDGAADVHVSTIEEVALDSWARERVVLIGDAAHATSPNMAEGAAMALEDALVLTDCLHRIRAISDVIAAFQARRQPRAEWVRTQTDRRDHTRYLPPTIRNNVLRLLGRRIFHANYRPLLDQP
jgi:2-polyprenyl-6-methoxyphenol hydroxylase-like FAD-dependent oxidoreductase